MNFTPFFAPATGAGPSQPALRAGTAWLAMPFDALRAQYAVAVRAGFLQSSLLASARVERALASLEQFVLGPWARRV